MADDPAGRTGSLDEPLDVGTVTGQDIGIQVSSCPGHGGIGDVDGLA
ncbi:MAG TPA: hypothetical protein VMV25_13840 [Steroidobacteraceae bacterium]|nr:hypothetical protein [Steroidobacteraceae bacterium]